ncbi:serine/threonine protein kinase [Streptomyces sp. WAC 06738]|uniref:serine/threonine-protein kinase n=1 Tax=Streptomyces sp. WAC 06738 TaxID=2203210 RepID=UPI000F6CD8AC|nr:serine/threonine-protein kinase [Streptomyces sp. WAC 06738]AZM47301.1 serine/threonine protein kinase [Streptomyces sp. WAC 06738]
MGEVFAGRYELIDPIGRGGVGAVWRAWDHRRRRYVAAKVLQQSDAHTLLRFVREQAVRIDHPHVLAPASWAADDDKVLFTMDLVGGGSLAHLIGDYGPLPPRFVCLLLDQLLAGLAAVHGENVVHRDIKPANVLLEATGTGRPHLRLSDFGISMRKGEPRLTDTNFVVGTPGYFAPEQMLGAEPDFPADLFAVGLLALYLLTGERPDSQALVEMYLKNGVPPAPKDVPEPLWQVLASLLQPDPEMRFRTATGTRKALAEAAELLPELDPAEEPVEVFDQLGPLPVGFGPRGPERAEERAAKGAPGPGPGLGAGAGPGPGPGAGFGAGAGPGAGFGTGTGLAGDAGAAGPAGPAYAPPGSTGYVPPPAAAAPEPGPAGPGTAHPPAAGPPGAGDPAEATSYGIAPPAASQPPTPTAPYTTAQPQPRSQPPQPRPGAAVPQRRPGPPAKVAIPVVVLAVLLMAAGVWALVSG